MERKDLHTHTRFSDGENTPEEMVLAAIDIGLPVLGLSDHAYTSFDTRYCMREGEVSRCRDIVHALAEKYRDKITVLCGIEQDYDADKPAEEYDYVIGSVHYLHCGDAYIPVDESADILLDAANRYFGGDMYALCEAYYCAEADVVRKTNADIIGHFDLISKFIERVPLFDETHPRYRAAWMVAADELLKTGKPFEINTGAITRGYRTTPYPSAEQRAYLKERGATFILSSDSHSADTLRRYDEWAVFTEGL